MKKKLTLLLSALFIVGTILTACGTKVEDNNSESGSVNEAGEQGTQELQKIKIGASPAPHAEILNAARELLEAEGFEMEIVEFVDYVQPNMALDSGDLDANYFQHQPYLEQFNLERNSDLAAAGFVHYEPFAIYPGRTATLEELQDGAKIAVPNDTTNEARALLLLEANGLIKLKEDAGINATKNDIQENPRNFEIVEVEAAQLPLVLQDVDLAVINGNFALSAGLKVNTDALASEDVDSVGASTYRNVIAVKAGNESNPGIEALLKVLQSDEIKKFIEDKYEGAVVPLF